jgi:hypothetical protein
MRPHLQQTLRVVVPLAGLASLLMAACTPHERFHHDLRELHEEFHEHPHTQAEHRRFHEDLEDLHRNYHDRGYYYGDRYW